MELSFESTTLVCSLLTCSYVLWKSFTPPNPTPPKDKQWGKDTMTNRRNEARRYIVISALPLSSLYHVLIILFPPTTPSLFCPHPSNLDPRLFTWSPYTAFWIAFVFLAGSIRLLAYAQLGQDFTFTLARPKGLVKTGLYRYVRHPSYPTLLACLDGAGALYVRWRGVLGCWLPEWIARWERADVFLLGALSLFMAGLLRQRVKEEEDMLRSEFGEEYEEYARTTKRFLPGII